VLGKRVVDLRHASPKHLIAPGSPASTVVQALRHVGPVRAADGAQIAAQRLSANDKKTLASTAFQAPAWMRATLVSIANAAVADIVGYRAMMSSSERLTGSMTGLSSCRSIEASAYDAVISSRWRELMPLTFACAEHSLPPVWKRVGQCGVLRAHSR
jgi:hypothetical protein